MKKPSHAGPLPPRGSTVAVSLPSARAAARFRDKFLSGQTAGSYGH